MTQAGLNDFMMQTGEDKADDVEGGVLRQSPRETSSVCNVCGAESLVFEYVMLGMWIPYCPTCFLAVRDKLEFDGNLYLEGQREKWFIEEVKKL